MPQRLPRTLIAALAFAALASLAFSIYMEQEHLIALQDHPVLTNLLSGITGFSFASLAIAVGFSWFTATEKVRSLRRKGFRQQWDRVMTDRNAALWYLQAAGSPPHAGYSENSEEQARTNANSEAIRLLDSLIKISYPQIIHDLELGGEPEIVSLQRQLEYQWATFSALRNEIIPGGWRVSLIDGSVLRQRMDELTQHIVASGIGRALRLEVSSQPSPS
jgi:hypothetical protein